MIFQFFLTCEWYEFLPHSWRAIFLGIVFLVNYHFIQDFESVISLTYCYCGFWWEISCLSYWRSLFSDASFFSWSFLTSFFVSDFWQFDYNTSGYGFFLKFYPIWSQINFQFRGVFAIIKKRKKERKYISEAFSLTFPLVFPLHVCGYT